MADAGWPAGVARIVLDEVGSTNAHALALGATGPVWVLAHRQTEGRGRRGRAWAAPEGNFAATLLTFPGTPPAITAQLSFVAALALADALAPLLPPSARLALKWPNDVLLDGGKLAGILLEGDGVGLAIGIGINLAAGPNPATLEPGAVPPAALAPHAQVTPEAFLDRLAPAFAAREAQWRAHGFAPIREAWLAQAARLGQTITARVGQRTHTGRFEGIDATGALLLDTASGREILPAADIHFEGA